MRGVNKVILIGNLGQDPEKKTANNGNSIAIISIATSDSWKDKSTGEIRERTEWHRVVFFGRLADVVCEYAHKGSKIYVEGRLATRKWQAQDGSDRYTTEVVVDIAGSMQLLDPAKQRGTDQSAYGQQAAPQQAAPQQAAPQQAPQRAQPSPTAQQTPELDSNFDDNIPF